ncbi:hypothetical protein [Acinetobacter sp. TR3]|uniref:hypothetical protein n=1 Tax=Acinetobacter sp. TR3 TaxID=3003392 RepID=UPI0022AC657F|nr:hypothetical protein [Acinetobacter sp. TR3]WAU77348.1 hypothetical protein O1449_03920 [Acinetobacter sp. TR3]
MFDEEVMKTCYMCASPQTSDEHVPPKCIFPEKKDSPDAKDYRKGLIKVPSCNIHNSAKSKEDEFFLMYMAAIFTTSEAASIHQNTKLIRILERKPHVWIELVKNSKPVQIIDEKGVKHQTCEFYLDPIRVSSQFDHIARGIHFYHFQEKWLNNISVHYLNGLKTDNQNINKANSEIAFVLEATFSDKEKHGQNQEVFYYQVMQDSSIKLIRAMFFEKVEVIFIYH